MRACIIVDDPTLTSRYGFIGFKHFLTWLKEEDLAATFALIPWNHRRTHRSIAGLFTANCDRLSICVHGCNHTTAEFASHDTRHLQDICALARHRMMSHQYTYDLEWDNVMVFPQGKFSREAMDALRVTGFAAAVNSIEPWCEYDLSSPYVEEFGFPLVTRRYPVSVERFVADARAGKPVLITQHHWDFADGYGSLTAFTRALKARIPGLKWQPLGQIISGLGLQAASPSMEHDVRQSIKTRISVASRRYLCELRDNVVHPARHYLRRGARRSLGR